MRTNAGEIHADFHISRVSLRRYSQRDHSLKPIANHDQNETKALKPKVKHKQNETNAFNSIVKQELIDPKALTHHVKHEQHASQVFDVLKVYGGLSTKWLFKIGMFLRAKEATKKACTYNANSSFSFDEAFVEATSSRE